jgi:hypothetical protein
MPGHGREEGQQACRKRGLNQADHKPPPEAKRQATAPPPAAAAAADDGDAAGAAPRQAQQEAVRASVRALFGHYRSLCNDAGGQPDAGAFQALLAASDGELQQARNRQLGRPAHPCRP